MAIDIVVNGVTIPFPEQGDPQPHGQPVTDFAENVASVLNTLLGPNDIVNTEVTLNNNQSSSLNIQRFFLDPAEVRGAICQYTVYRTTSGATYAETGTLFISKVAASPFWTFSREANGDAGIDFNFSASSNGQLQYTTSNLASHVGSTLFFSVKAFS